MCRHGTLSKRTEPCSRYNWTVAVFSGSRSPSSGDLPSPDNGMPAPGSFGDNRVPIHRTAIVSRDAELGEEVFVGPMAIIESDTIIGDRCCIQSHATIKSGSRLGEGNFVGEGAVIGGRPQHLGAGDDVGELLIGDHNTIREHVTLHRALNPADVTRIGGHNLIMVAAHVGHDCWIGDHNTIANNVMLAGHVTVSDRAFLSGAVAVHQFCRIGSFAMVGGQSHVTKDVPPYVTVDGLTSRLVGLNRIGLQRNGFSAAEMAELKCAYRLAFRSGLPRQAILSQLAEEFPTGCVAELWRFLSRSERGWLQDRRSPGTHVIKLNLIDPADEGETPSRKAA